MFIISERGDTVSEKRSIIYIPGLYFLLMLILSILASPIWDSIDIVDENLKLIRFSSYFNILFYGSLFVLYIVLYKDSWRNSIKSFYQKKEPHIQIIIIGLLSMFGIMIILGYIYTLFGITESPENQQLLDMQLNGSLFDKISLVIFAGFLAPLVEENLFRLSGFYYFRKIKNIPDWAVITITSLLFGLIHVLGDDIIQIIYYAALGAVLGTIYHKSKNILVPIIVHMIFNLFVTALMFIGL